MSIKPITLSTCAAILLAAVPSTVHAQSFGDLVRDVKRAADALEDAVGDDTRRGTDERASPGDRSYLGDASVLDSGPMLAGTEHLMLVKVNEPIVEKGTYRVILRQAGTRGQRGIRSTTYLSDTDLDEADTHVVVRVDAPDTPGQYQLQVTAEDVDNVISSTPVSVELDARPIIGDLPTTASRGARVPVTLRGPRYYYNRVSFVENRRTAKTVQYDAIISDEGEYLVMPTRAGRYDIVVHYRASDGKDYQANAGRITVR